MSDTCKSPLPEGHNETVKRAAEQLMESVELQNQQYKIIKIVSELLRYGANEEEAAHFIAALSSVVGRPKQQFDTFIAAFECMISVYVQNQKLHDQLKAQGVAVQQSSFAVDAKKPVADQQSSFATVTKQSLHLQPKKSPSPVQQMPDSSKLVISGPWALAAEEEDRKSDVSSTYSDVDPEGFRVVDKKLLSDAKVCECYVLWLMQVHCITYCDVHKGCCDTCGNHHLSTSTKSPIVSALDTKNPLFKPFDSLKKIFPLRFKDENEKTMFVHFVCGLPKPFYPYGSILCAKCNEHPALAIQFKDQEFFVIFSRCLGCCNEGGKQQVIRDIITNMAKEFKASCDEAADMPIRQIVSSFMDMLTIPDRV
jgi:hypothetical protein